jgi:FlaA1/EpsC-like NDP-sugar epimerase
MQGGEVFIYKMPAIRIKDLAEAMIEAFAPKHNVSPENIEIKMVGRRPGETFHEEIMTTSESTRVYENESLYSVSPETTGYLSYEPPEEFIKATDIVRSSETAEKLTKEEIIALLERNGVAGSE